MSGSLAGKVVLITGAARGIGRATARELARRGARVALVGMEPELLAEAARELGPGHAYSACDVTNQASLERAVRETVVALGGIDVVMANAGIGTMGSVAANRADDLVRTVDVNLNGVIRTVHATLSEVTRRRGYYLVISSAAALQALPGMAAYAASKIAVELFANALRGELVSSGVSVGVAHPGWIDTDLVRDAAAELPTAGALMRALPWPLNRILPVETCVRELVNGIEQRRRKIYIPRVLGLIAPLRGLLWTRFGDRLAATAARTRLPQLDAEVQALGRSFGKHSVAMAVLPEPSRSPRREPGRP